MTSSGEARELREGSSVKRASILAAARELFLNEGYDGSSVDAVAARAGVSKRTVYDYYGDKRALLLAVLVDTGRSLMTSIHAAIDAHLTEVTDLEAALTAFAREIATEAFASSDYAVRRRLFFNEAHRLHEPESHWLADAPENALAERFAALTQAGQLDAPNPRLAADHFVALTFSLAIDRPGPGNDTAAQLVDQAITDGVSAFLRAYGSPDGRLHRAARGRRRSP